MKTVMTIEDIREELRRVSARVREMTHEQRYRSPAVRRRDELILVALDSGVRPGWVASDSGLARSRIYQIKKVRRAAEEAPPEIEKEKS